MTRVRAVLVAVVLALLLAGCSDINITSNNIVPGNEGEVRAIERHRAANGARNTMILLLIGVVGPLGIATVIIAAVDRDRRGD